MNAERILQLADVIEKTPHKAIKFETDGLLDGFNMAQVKCGTVGCIKGWAQQLFNDTGDAALGLKWDQAEQLFYPEMTGRRYEDVTPAEAAAALRHLAATGEVDWSIGA